jgi:hypothetical protein
MGDKMKYYIFVVRIKGRADDYSPFFDYDERCELFWDRFPTKEDVCKQIAIDHGWSDGWIEIVNIRSVSVMTEEEYDIFFGG